VLATPSLGHQNIAVRTRQGNDKTFCFFCFFVFVGSLFFWFFAFRGLGLAKAA
jgi:hypothetical protein